MAFPTLTTLTQMFENLSQTNHNPSFESYVCKSLKLQKSKRILLVCLQSSAIKTRKNWQNLFESGVYARNFFCSHNFFPEGFQNSSKENLFFIDCRYIIVVFHSYFASYFLLQEDIFKISFCFCIVRSQCQKLKAIRKHRLNFDLEQAKNRQGRSEPKFSKPNQARAQTL